MLFAAFHIVPDGMLIFKVNYFLSVHKKIAVKPIKKRDGYLLFFVIFKFGRTFLSEILKKTTLNNPYRKNVHANMYEYMEKTVFIYKYEAQTYMIITS